MRAVINLRGCNTPDILLLLEALREVPDGLDTLLCGQGHQLLNQVLFLCQMSGNKKKKKKMSHLRRNALRKTKLGIRSGYRSPARPQWRPP